MNRKSSGKNKKRVALVPTLDIDLCWHTHQLNSVSYREWCIEHLGVAVNHDDTVGQESLDNGLRETTSAWYGAYRESYAPNEPSDAKSRTIAGVRGLFSRNKGEKSTQPKKDAANGKGDDTMASYMSMYPYWLNYPYGWNYPAACANSGKSGGYRGWAASVDQQREVSTNAGAKCAGCTSGCTYAWGD